MFSLTVSLEQEYQRLTFDKHLTFDKPSNIK